MFQPLYGGRNSASKIAILISDGRFHYKRKTKREATKAKQEGIYIFGIGVGERVNMEELRDISSDPDDQFVFKVKNFNALDKINYKIPTTFKMCNNTTK